MSRRGPCRPSAKARSRYPAWRRHRDSHPPVRQRRGRAARRSSGRSLHLHPRKAAPGLRTRGHDARDAHSGDLHHGSAGRQRRHSRPRRLDQHGRHSGRHPVWQTAARPRCRHAGAPRARPRRPCGRDRGRDPDEALEEAERNPRAVPRDGNRR